MEKTATAPSASWVQPVLAILALLVCVGAVARMLDGDVAERIDETTLLYFGVAGALLLLRDVKSLAFGDYKVEFDRKIVELENKVENAQAVAIGKGGQARSVEAVDAGVEGLQKTAEFKPPLGPVADDPWNGVFGGQRISGTRELDAEVTPVGTPGLFRVRLQVRSKNQIRDPLRGAVQFFLHPTFGNDRPVVTVGPSGIAELALTAWGAFTVGALADDGRTKLELDLAGLADAPAEFKAR